MPALALSGSVGPFVGALALKNELTPSSENKFVQNCFHVKTSINITLTKVYLHYFQIFYISVSFFVFETE